MGFSVLLLSTVQAAKQESLTANVQRRHHQRYYSKKKNPKNNEKLSD